MQLQVTENILTLNLLTAGPDFIIFLVLINASF